MEVRSEWDFARIDYILTHTYAIDLLVYCYGSLFDTLDKSPPVQMAAISQTIFSDAFFVNEKVCILISLKFVPNGSIDNRVALVQVMAWHRTGDKPLPEPMLAQFNDAYMRH